MKAQLVMLSAAALLAASTARAEPAEAQQFVGQAQARADAMLRDAGVDLKGAAVSVRATVSADGHLTGVRVVRSSGSRDTDHTVETVLRKIVVTDAPVGLIGGAVTLNVHAASVVAAATP